MRSVSYFDGKGATYPLVILSAWVAIGVALTLIGAAKHKAERLAQASEQVVAV